MQWTETIFIGRWSRRLWTRGEEETSEDCPRVCRVPSEVLPFAQYLCAQRMSDPVLMCFGVARVRLCVGATSIWSWWMVMGCMSWAATAKSGCVENLGLDVHAGVNNDVRWGRIERDLERDRSPLSIPCEVESSGLYSDSTYVNESHME